LTGLPFITILKYKRPALAVLSLSMITVEVDSGYEWDKKSTVLEGVLDMVVYCALCLE
jgi:hypothetical protein